MFIQETDSGILFKIKIQPNAKKNAIVGLLGDALKIQITSPPIDGAANKCCIKFLSKTFKVNKSKIQIVSGGKNRNKILQIKGLSKELLLQLLKDLPQRR